MSDDVANDVDDDDATVVVFEATTVNYPFVFNFVSALAFVATTLVAAPIDALANALVHVIVALASASNTYDKTKQLSKPLSIWH